MNVIQRTEKLIDEISRKMEADNYTVSLEYLNRTLVALKDELSKPVPGARRISDHSYGLLRVLQESSLQDTVLGEEIFDLLSELRKYRRQLKQELPQYSKLLTKLLNWLGSSEENK